MVAIHYCDCIWHLASWLNISYAAQLLCAKTRDARERDFLSCVQWDNAIRSTNQSKILPLFFSVFPQHLVGWEGTKGVNTGNFCRHPLITTSRLLQTWSHAVSRASGQQGHSQYEEQVHHISLEIRDSGGIRCVASRFHTKSCRAAQEVRSCHCLVQSCPQS